MDVVAYALAKKYTDETAIQFGGLKGSPATIKSITPSDDGTYNTVVFSWKNDDGQTRESSMIVKNGSIGDITPTLTEGLKIADIVKDGVSSELYIPVGAGGASITEEINASKTVGGISSGNHFEAGTPIEQILKSLLNPVEHPTLTNPSATISSSIDKLLEKGSSVNAVLTVNFNRGSISPAYGTSGKRSGEATGYTLNGGAEQVGKIFSVVVDEAHGTYTAVVKYAEGEQPKDSTGANYSTPLPAGNVTSSAFTYEFVNAIWANTTTATSIGKIDLISAATAQATINFPAATSANPEVFDVPVEWTVIAIEVKNDFTGAWEDCSDEFTASNITHEDAAGTTVTYVRYTCNKGYNMGARPIRIKWSA